MTEKSNRPIVERSCFIHDNSLIIGAVVISRNCSVWPYAVLRGDEEPITIDERSNVQDGVVIHTDHGYPVTIGKEVSIGHGAIIHGCKIGDRCIIGIRSTILNGSEIGEGSIVGAGAVITPGTKIPPHSMVLGIPGKVKKEDTSFLEMARENADIYVDLAMKHKNGMINVYEP